MNFHIYTLILFTILIPTTAFPALPQGEFLGSRSSQFEGIFYDFQLTKKPLNAAPKWASKSNDYPPLSPKKAEQIATAQLKLLIPEMHQWMQISSINLEKLYDDDWIYLVEFEYSPPTAYSGPSRLLTIPVYLDGSTITPKTRKTK